MALPIIHNTRPAPTEESFAPATDQCVPRAPAFFFSSAHASTARSRESALPLSAGRRPWSNEDDEKLRKLVAEYSTAPTIPWPTIATRANMGHNSGSCAKRWATISEDKSLFSEGKRFEFAGRKGGGAYKAYGGPFDRELMILPDGRVGYNPEGYIPNPAQPRKGQFP